jgi:hypothetical protein
MNIKSLHLSHIMKSISTFLTSMLHAVTGAEAKPLKVFILAGQSNMKSALHNRVAADRPRPKTFVFPQGLLATGLAG